MNGEDGAGTISATATITAIILVVSIFLFGIALHVEKTRSQTALDFAALGAAHAAVTQLSQVGAIDPCTTAHHMSHHNGVTVTQCYLKNVDVYLVGEKPVSFLNYTFSLTMRSHSGYIKEFLSN